LVIKTIEGVGYKWNRSDGEHDVYKKDGRPILLIPKHREIKEALIKSWCKSAIGILPKIEAKSGAILVVWRVFSTKILGNITSQICAIRLNQRFPNSNTARAILTAAGVRDQLRK